MSKKLPFQTKEPKPVERIEVPSYWRCKCERITAAYREFCDSCGSHKHETKRKK